MRSRLLAAMLLPLLLIQGRRVKKQTPRLPEAAGDRQGSCGRGPSLTLWVVGDSAAAGVGVATQAQALSGQLADLLRHHRSVHWQCHATTGHCAADTADRLSKLPAENIDVMVCSVGVNDTVGFRALRDWCRALKQIHQLAKTRFDVKLLIFTQVPPMQAFPALPVPLNYVLGMHARRLNKALCAYAEKHDEVLALAPTAGDVAGMMASDGFHPGEAGYRQWAKAIVAALDQNLLRRDTIITDKDELCSTDATNNQKGI